MDYVVGVIVAVAAVVILGLMYSLCRVAGDADREMERWFKEIKEARK